MIRIKHHRRSDFDPGPREPPRLNDVPRPGTVGARAADQPDHPRSADDRARALEHVRAQPHGRDPARVQLHEVRRHREGARPVRLARDGPAADRVAARRHQAIVRFYFVYPGNPTTVPGYIKAHARLPRDPRAERGEADRRSPTGRTALQEFTLEFYEKLAARYDDDPRLAFVETGFGLWAEYHIYSGPMDAGQDVPGQVVPGRVRPPARPRLPEDALDDLGRRGGRPVRRRSPRQQDLMKLPFGVFDDSFLCQQHARVNEPNWNVMGRDRWKRAPAGGEISYYTARDQKQALAANGPHGIPFENAAAAFHITFMIANDQPKYRPTGPHPLGRPGVRLPVPHPEFEASASRSRVTVTNRASRRSITTPISRSTASAPSGRSRGCCRASRGPTRSPPAAPRRS